MRVIETFLQENHFCRKKFNNTENILIPFFFCWSTYFSTSPWGTIRSSLLWINSCGISIGCNCYEKMLFKISFPNLFGLNFLIKVFLAHHWIQSWSNLNNFCENGCQERMIISGERFKTTHRNTWYTEVPIPSPFATTLEMQWWVLSRWVLEITKNRKLQSKNDEQKTAAHIKRDRVHNDPRHFDAIVWREFAADLTVWCSTVVSEKSPINVCTISAEHMKEQTPRNARWWPEELKLRNDWQHNNTRQQLSSPVRHKDLRCNALQSLGRNCQYKWCTFRVRRLNEGTETWALASLRWSPQDEWTGHASERIF